MQVILAEGTGYNPAFVQSKGGRGTQRDDAKENASLIYAVSLILFGFIQIFVSLLLISNFMIVCKSVPSG